MSDISSECCCKQLWLIQIWKNNVMKHKCETKNEKKAVSISLGVSSSVQGAKDDNHQCKVPKRLLLSLAPCTDDDTPSGIETSVCAFFVSHLCFVTLVFSDLDSPAQRIYLDFHNFDWYMMTTFSFEIIAAFPSTVLTVWAVVCFIFKEKIFTVTRTKLRVFSRFNKLFKNKT